MRGVRIEVAARHTYAIPTPYLRHTYAVQSQRMPIEQLELRRLNPTGGGVSLSGGATYPTWECGNVSIGVGIWALGL